MNYQSLIENRINFGFRAAWELLLRAELRKAGQFLVRVGLHQLWQLFIVKELRTSRQLAFRVGRSACGKQLVHTQLRASRVVIVPLRMYVRCLGGTQGVHFRFPACGQLALVA